MAKWLVKYHHDKIGSGSGSSWWGDWIVNADTAEGAAIKAATPEAIKEHGKDSQRLRLRVYGPIPEEVALEVEATPSVQLRVLP